jgi:hypothetical protein
LFKENRLAGKFGRTFQWQGEKGKGFKVFSLIFMLERVSRLKGKLLKSICKFQ